MVGAYLFEQHYYLVEAVYYGHFLLGITWDIVEFRLAKVGPFFIYLVESSLLLFCTVRTAYNHLIKQIYHVDYLLSLAFYFIDSQNWCFKVFNHF